MMTYLLFQEDPKEIQEHAKTLFEGKRGPKPTTPPTRSRSFCKERDRQTEDGAELVKKSPKSTRDNTSGMDRQRRKHDYD